ncbi:hypothetical protein A3H89_04550 [Candidatus Amesbacteria bacterium RIFCSPLOWO2_02_FULL_48_11]|uniref:Glycosyltransferase 2-like domain-containing protein n=5 Tax=Candidatus Amesiibacteriota TaxID=1752730 RepID=A0A1F4Z7I7_9BACT|nr:MAG: hypothetical protein UX78_C0008G0007 [Candidatus Amesbacteria bacterium GW2011_GWA2_47_11]KKU94712.1 MAG: hypothetical protein UY22_C0008G0009 [Candidatus Amesbacteria bacterium GW2011_GWC1_48_10]KKW00893.1 MAG: hypothetical protein UY33_C0003G0021 [Candidatus Amesbacteria bacterium GW2011_GWA1_48_9]OGC90039.1 MAG: hypothetical protein A2V48_01365 [Candidatus Amesbacteria bacterium RBG_19FT_COMBO_48_16]OGC97264.1 MAG: hypothetical protein A3C34_04465 [Candidatus Amesbacteria bacterium R
MKVSVVIPVSNDLRLKTCVDSIDEAVEVVISLNRPTETIKKLVDKMISQKKRAGLYPNISFTVCEIPYASIAGAYNNGIKSSHFDNVLLMDSDCTFKKKTIKKLFKNLGNNLLSKGKVIFKSNSWITAVVSRAREFHTSDKINAYSPPLLFNKKIKNFIGGYYFHPSLCWLEDSEFDKRVQKANLRISYNPSAVVYHPPLTPFRDLKSAFWYGVGKRIGVELGVHDKPTGFIGSVRKYIFEASKIKGVLSGLYLFIWKMTLLFGYYFQLVMKIRKNRI